MQLVDVNKDSDMVFSLRSDDGDEHDEWFSVEDLTMDAWQRIFSDSDELLVTGTANTWQGGRTMKPTLLHDNTLSEVLSHMDVDVLEVKVYKEHVEVINHHHDGSNYYVVRPFDWRMLTKVQLKIMVDDSLQDDFVRFMYNDNRGAPSKARKADLIEFHQEVGTDLIVC